MLLSKGQMTDHQGATLVLDALPPAKTLIADRGYDSARSARHSAPKASSPGFHRAGAGKSLTLTTERSIANAAGSRTSSPSSKTGDASRHAMTDASTPSSQPSASLQLSSSGSDQQVLSLAPNRLRWPGSEQCRPWGGAAPILSSRSVVCFLATEPDHSWRQLSGDGLRARETRLCRCNVSIS
jgi:hypothetical protein